MRLQYRLADTGATVFVWRLKLFTVQNLRAPLTSSVRPYGTQMQTAVRGAGQHA